MNDSAFLILFIAFTAFMGIVPFLFRRFGIPMVISLLVVGMAIGPTGLSRFRFKSVIISGDKTGNNRRAFQQSCEFSRLVGVGFSDGIGGDGSGFQIDPCCPETGDRIEYSHVSAAGDRWLFCVLLFLSERSAG